LVLGVAFRSRGFIRVLRLSAKNEIKTL